MLDILMPVRVDQIHLAMGQFLSWDPEGDPMELPVDGRGAIDLIGEMTDVPFRLVICVDGGIREDVASLRSYLPNSPFEWSLLQNDSVRGMRHTMKVLSDAVRNDYVAVIPPNIWIDDPQWFGKMQVVFTKDRHTFIVAGDVPNTASKTVPPFKLDYRHHPKSNFFLSRRMAFQSIGEFSGSEEFSQKAHQLGGTRWVASGVHYEDMHDNANSGIL